MLEIAIKVNVRGTYDKPIPICYLFIRALELKNVNRAWLSDTF
jgi:hypothetical protein